MLHSKFLADLDCDRLRVRLVALFPKHKRWINLQLLRDDCPEREHRLRVRGFVALHRDRFDLSAGAIANVKSGRNLAAPAWRDFVLVGLSCSATGGSVDKLKSHR